MHNWFQSDSSYRASLGSDTSELPLPPSFHRMVGASRAMRKLKRLLSRIASSPATSILLLGESGTGKSMIAREIHRNSPRRALPFQLICCSALSEHLLESELFGHEAGSFTDAKRRKLGLVEAGDGGSIFLDEIGEISLDLQVKLLRFLEERRFTRVGGTEDLVVDVRIIAATNRELSRAVRSGSFREDLYYRLNVLPLRIPPLRERIEDVPLLVDCFIDEFNETYGKEVTRVSPEARNLLLAYEWPGNVRELRNLIERAVLLSTSDQLDPDDFVAFGEDLRRDSGFELPPGGIDLEQLEANLLRQALQRTGGNKTRAAELLGLTRHQIHYRIGKQQDERDD